ncbi:hypothetical protein PG994_006269 [Apiospora phragmitis]|uniref:Peroxin 20 n=1 Tax=Apiospora phragmitis TaxID=2905665 RepID=A0ABR1VEN8_9PEZI
MADSFCGPSNAAKGLAQHFDQDRSRQQDRIQGPNQPGEALRALRTWAPNILLLWHSRICKGDWASQFQNMSLHGQPMHATTSSQAQLPQAHQSPSMSNPAFMPQNPMQMGPFAVPGSGYGQMGPMMPFGPFNNQAGGFMAPAGPAMDSREEKEWHAQQMMDRQINDEEFDLALEDWMNSNHDTGLLSRAEVLNPVPVEVQKPKSEPIHNPQNETELARVAQQLVDSVASDESEKFRNSSFLSLMRRIAAKEVVIQDSNLVEASTADSTNAAPGSSIGSYVTPGSSSVSESPSSESASDPKGKGKQKATEPLSP